VLAAKAAGSAFRSTRGTLREGVRVMSQALMELEVAQPLGAERYQRSPDRQGGRQARRLSGDAA